MVNADRILSFVASTREHVFVRVEVRDLTPQPLPIWEGEDAAAGHPFPPPWGR